MLEMEYELQGFDEQIAKIDGAEAIITRIFNPLMAKSAIHVEGEVKERTPVGVSGDARRSIKSETIPMSSGPILIRSKVGSKIKGPQMPTIEHGRKAGARMPPPTALSLWVQRVLGITGPQIKRVAFVVARSIGRRGIKGVHMFREGWKAGKPVVNRYMQQGLAEVTEALKVVR